MTGYGGLGFDLDEEGNHRIDGSIFYTRTSTKRWSCGRTATCRASTTGLPPSQQASEGRIDPHRFFPPVSGAAAVSRRLRHARLLVRERRAKARPNSSNARTTDRSGSRASAQSLVRHRARPDRLPDQRRSPSSNALEGLHFTWAANKAKTTQTETALGARIFFEPDNEHSSGLRDSDHVSRSTGGRHPRGRRGRGRGARRDRSVRDEQQRHRSRASNDIHEIAYFGRFDLRIRVRSPRSAHAASSAAAAGSRTRSATSSRTSSRTATVGGHRRTSRIIGATPRGAGRRDLRARSTGSLREGDQRFQARHPGRKLRAQGHPLGQARPARRAAHRRHPDRVEQRALHRRASGSARPPPSRTSTSSSIGSTIRTAARSRAFDPNATYNDQLLGIDVPLGSVSATRRKRSESHTPVRRSLESDWIRPTARRSSRSSTARSTSGSILPAAGLAYRPLEGLSLRGAWSQTVARPSFREMGFYASVELGTDDLVVGNPQLQLSEVESWDARVEYTWGELGELAAISAFYKTIEHPIESIVVRNPDQSRKATRSGARSSTTRTRRSSGGSSSKRARTSASSVPSCSSTSRSAATSRTSTRRWIAPTPSCRARSSSSDTGPARRRSYTGLKTSRRLFGQPEWIVNTDLSFDQPDWGTQVTLVVLRDQRPARRRRHRATCRPDGRVTSLTLDRYIDSFYTLDLVFSQTFPFDVPLGSLGLEGTLPSALDLQGQREEPHRQHAQASSTTAPRPSQKVAERSLQGRSRLLLLAHVLVRLLTRSRAPGAPAGAACVTIVKSAKIA